jgi:hypothetical protein
MKTMLALALVGLLSISSLAEAKNDTKASAKSKTVQRGPSSAELNCPAGFVKITGQGNTNDFCISETVQNDKKWEEAISHCINMKFSKEFKGGKASLCKLDEWKLACEQNRSNLGMAGAREWVNFKDSDGDVGAMGMDSRRCDSLSIHPPSPFLFDSRCCFRKDK